MSTLFSSGSNAHGQLANGSLNDSHTFRPCSFYGCTPGSLPPNTARIINITGGANHTLVLLETINNEGKSCAELWGCGDGAAGQLGPIYQKYMDGKSDSIFKPIDVSFGQEHLQQYACKEVRASWETTYIVLSCMGKKDVLIAMGADDFGDLGTGGIQKGNRKGKEVAKSFHIVNFDHLCINNLSLKFACVDINSIEAGQHHVIALLHATWNDSSADIVVGWGASRHGQLGNAVDPNGKTIPFLALPRVINTADRIVALSLGNQHSILLGASKRISALGSNRKNQLQGLENLDDVWSVGCTWNGTYAVVGDGVESRVFATGNHYNGQLGRNISSNFVQSKDLLPLAPVEFPFTSLTHRLNAIACGSEHVLALFSVDQTSDEHQPERNAEVWGWGWNEHGNLGIGTTEDASLPVKIWPSTHTTERPQKAVGIWGGMGTSWIYCTTG